MFLSAELLIGQQVPFQMTTTRVFGVRDLAILLLEGGCCRPGLPRSTGQELYAFLETCREHETSRHHMSPSLKLDCLWHWMLLNTDVSSCVHEALGGVVPHSTSTESDSLEEKNKRRRRSMELMTSMGYSPDPELWTDDDCKREEDSGNDVSDDHLRRSTGVQGQNRRTFRVLVKTMTGKRIIVEGLTASTTVAALKSAVQDKEGIPPDQFNLIYTTQGTGIAEDDWTLGEYNIDRDATMHLILNLRGC